MQLWMHETSLLDGLVPIMSPLTLRHTEVEVGVRVGAYRTTVAVSTRKERFNFIIGSDI